MFWENWQDRNWNVRTLVNKKKTHNVIMTCTGKLDKRENWKVILQKKKSQKESKQIIDLKYSEM